DALEQQVQVAERDQLCLFAVHASDILANGVMSQDRIARDTGEGRRRGRCVRERGPRCGGVGWATAALLGLLGAEPAGACARVGTPPPIASIKPGAVHQPRWGSSSAATPIS